MLEFDTGIFGCELPIGLGVVEVPIASEDQRARPSRALGWLATTVATTSAKAYMDLCRGAAA